MSKCASLRVGEGSNRSAVPRCLQYPPGLPGGSVGSLPAVRETSVQFLGQKNPLEKGVATHPSILA